MQLDLDNLRQHYDRLSDEALLEVTRGDLVDQARDIYDAELARRGLHPVPAAPPPSAAREEANELVFLADFDDPGEAQMARSLLESTGIPCWSKGDRVMAAGVPDNSPYYLVVQRGALEVAREVLAAPISDEELAAQAEAAAPPPEE